jgi:ribosome-interacting GTPase 1
LRRSATFTAIAESIQNEWKYTSGVIAWSKDDAPTNEEIDQVLEAFEKHAFAGLQPINITLQQFCMKKMTAPSMCIF